MGQTYPPWLSKEMVKGAKGFNLDAYVMALEGWRRSLTLTWYDDLSRESDVKMTGFNHVGKCFSLASLKGKKTHYFYRTRGDMVTGEAIKSVQDKFVAKQYLHESNVPTPKAILVRKDMTDADVIDRIKVLSFPLVVKPTSGSLGKGVEVNLQSEGEVLTAIKEIRSNYKDYEDIMVEEQVSGNDYRIYVVGDHVVAGTKRIPANVKGDGENTIAQLIENKNALRKDNPYLANKQIKMDDDLTRYLHNQGKSIADIPSKEEVVFLVGTANISTGGDPIDATDELTEEIKQTAINATRAIPGLHHAGVDVIANDNDISIIEINHTADISMHVFPLEGTPRNVPAAIIDTYFPRTKGSSDNRTDIYFDYRKIRQILVKGQAKSITLTNAPKGKLHKKRYIASGKVQKVNYRNWIRKQAVNNDLHGYTRNLKDGRVVVVVAGSNKQTVDDFKQVCLKGSPRSKVEEVKVLSWKRPVELGFEIRKTK